MEREGGIIWKTENYSINEKGILQFDLHIEKFIMKRVPIDNISIKLIWPQSPEQLNIDGEI